ncbi:MAG: hypothetical protein Q9169_004089, partial [Polycauliona sp. 2 TL-2023]
GIQISMIKTQSTADASQGLLGDLETPASIPMVAVIVEVVNKRERENLLYQTFAEKGKKYPIDSEDEPDVYNDQDRDVINIWHITLIAHGLFTK